jgi:hypothetical protein
LPLEMISIRLVGAHARGRVSYEFSLTRCGKLGARRVSVCNVKDKNGGRLVRSGVSSGTQPPTFRGPGISVN